jgi:hypothetical protein
LRGVSWFLRDDHALFAQPYREVLMSHRLLRFALPLLGVLLLAPAAGRAATLGEALAAEQLIRKVDAMAPADRQAFIQQNRAQLNQALLLHQIVLTVSHAVEAASQAAGRLYHQPLICILGSSDEDDRKTEPAPDLEVMAEDFKADLRQSLKLPDNAATEERLNKIDVADVIANRMIEDNKCPQR